MKLRFDHQSLRLRVRKSDLQQLAATGAVENVVHFPQGSLTYRLEMSPDTPQVACQFSDGLIRVTLPASQARRWIDSDEVGIYSQVPTSLPELALQLILEKDFPCKHTSADDRADTFDHLVG